MKESSDGTTESNRNTGFNSLIVRIRNVLFGDRLGLVVFLGTLCFAILYWRVGVLISDNETLIRTLEGVSEGHLWIEPVTEGSNFDGPGAEIRDGYVYGRNYGQLVASLPFLWILELIDRVVHLRVALFALWHLLALALTVQLGRLFDRVEEFAIGGSALVLASFVVNLVLATQSVDPRLALVALQLATLTATGFVAVFLYRLVAFQRDRRLGALVGTAGVVVLPVGFWASVPKRHVFSSLVCVLVLYLFARSRAPDATVTVPSLGQLPLYRAGAYIAVGFLTWIHAAEGLFVFLTLVAVDLPTAPSNDRRTLAVVGGLFAVSLLPTVTTNLLVTGEAIRPPRTLGGSGITSPAAIEQIDGTNAASDGGGSSESDSLVPQFISDFFLFSAFGYLVTNVSGLVADSLSVLSNGERVTEILFRSQNAEIPKGKIEFREINLAVLESMPLLGAGVGILVAAISRRLVSVRNRFDQLGSLREIPGRLDPTGVLAGSLIVAFLAIYLSRLPLHVQINQRYILPVYPLALYLCTHSKVLRTVVDKQIRLVLWSYVAGILLGTQLFVAYIAQQNLTVAEAARANATLALVVATIVGISVFVSAVTGRYRRFTGVTLGVACATGTLFLLVSGIHYFSHVLEFVIPVVQLLSDLLEPYR